MPYNSTTGIVSIDTSTTPNQGVSIHDIQQAVGRGRSDIGGLITYGNINPWAKYKPVRASDKDMVIRTLNIASLGFGTSSGSSGIPYATTVNGLISLYTDGETNTLYNARANGWRYLRPRGLANNEWFRFYDFIKVVTVNGTKQPVSGVGYHASARNPFGRFTCPESVSHYSGAFVASNSTIIPSTGTPEYDIAIEDINAVMANAYKMLYYGVMLVPESSSGTCYFIFNNSTTINDDNVDADYIRGNESLALDTFLLSDTMPTGNYTAYPFLTNMPISSLSRSITVTNRSSAISNDYPRLYPLPGTVPSVVNIYDTPVVINVYAVGSAQTLDYVTFTGEIYVTIQNNTDSVVTVPRLELQWRTQSSTFADNRRSGEYFYDGQYVINDSHPSGYADASYASFLRPTNAYEIQPNETLRIPGGELSLAVTIPSRNAATLIIGDPAYPNRYGTTTFRMPAGGNMNELEQP